MARRYRQVIDGEETTVTRGGTSRGLLVPSRAADPAKWYALRKDVINRKRRDRYARSGARKRVHQAKLKEAYARDKQKVFYNTPEGKLFRKLRRNGFTIEEAKREAKRLILQQK